MTTYIEQLKAGPFVGRIDPWSENARYFHQMHGGIIEYILRQIQDPLLQMGYVASKELSLQIMGGREPDISVHRGRTRLTDVAWNYDAAATALQVEAGIEVEQLDLDRIDILQADGTLVTVLEVISPGNKTRLNSVEEYIARRDDLVYLQGINVVEIDATRSYRRLIEHYYTSLYSYMTMIYMPANNPRIIGSHLNEQLKRFALPLRQAVVPVEPHQAYQDAYQSAAIARQIEFNHDYALQSLPYPTLLSPAEQAECFAAIDVWRESLEQLQKDEKI